MHMLEHDCTIFMQDGAPCHKSKIFFGSNKITFLKCPANSFKLNPIENFWTVLVDKVAQKHPPNILALIKAIILVWILEITDGFC